MPRTKDFDILEDPDRLRFLYHDMGLTMQEIASMEGCVDSTVLSYMRKHDIERRTKGVQSGADSINGADAGYSGSWSSAKRKVRDRDNNTCQSCGVSEEEM